MPIKISEADGTKMNRSVEDINYTYIAAYYATFERVSLPIPALLTVDFNVNLNSKK